MTTQLKDSEEIFGHLCKRIGTPLTIVSGNPCSIESGSPVMQAYMWTPWHNGQGLCPFSGTSVGTWNLRKVRLLETLPPWYLGRYASLGPFPLGTSEGTPPWDPSPLVPRKVRLLETPLLRGRTCFLGFLVRDSFVGYAAAVAAADAPPLLLPWLFSSVSVSKTASEGRHGETATAVMISQFFVLSLRGDNIVFRDCKFFRQFLSSLPDFSLIDLLTRALTSSIAPNLFVHWW
jgi:hypothetical protein